MRGSHAYSHFIGKGGHFLAVFPGRENLENGVFFVTSNGNQYPRYGSISFSRDRGVQVMGNEHTVGTPWFYGEGGGGGSGTLLTSS